MSEASITSGEVRINGAHVFISDTQVASLKPDPPVRAVRKQMPVAGTAPSQSHPPAADSGRAQILKVPCIKQDMHDPCGRASGAMVKRYFHLGATTGSTYRDKKKRVHQSLAMLSAASVSSSTGKDWTTDTTPSMTYTSVYERRRHNKKPDKIGNHIFVLTGYDPAVHPEEGDQFYANNTFGHGPEGGDPVGLTEINHVSLTADSLAKRLYSQGPPGGQHNVIYVKLK